VGRLYRLRKGILAFWDRDDVNVIVHQRVRPNEHSMKLTGIPRQAEIHKPIRVIMENVFFAVTSLQDVMRTTWDNDASESHGGTFRYAKGDDSLHPRRAQQQLKLSQNLGDLYVCPRIIRINR
jgi:hypothetical protein